jgi:DNA mismatch repair protein MutS
MAGMPQQVISRANKILKKLEKSHKMEDSGEILKNSAEQEMQLSFFNLDDPLLQELKEELLHIDIDTLTPIEALMKLNEIKRMLSGKQKAQV